MTCVLSTGPWHHFNDHIPWSPMNSDGMAGLPPLDSKPQSQGYVSSAGSDTRKSSTSSGKKRASRAGTRSVTTLSAAQLERKRANDREAQRAIRQRTKDHIDHLEGNLNELRSAQESSEKMVQVTQQRNRELENENAYLRSKLQEAGFSLNLPTTEGRRLRIEYARCAAVLTCTHSSATCRSRSPASSFNISRRPVWPASRFDICTKHPLEFWSWVVAASDHRIRVWRQ